MSYILDALRRADAERERGAVPSLQSQHHAYVEDDAARPARPRALVWAVAALSVALVAVLAWTVFGGSRTPPARPVAEGSVAPAPTAPAVQLPTSPPVAAPPVTAPPAAAAPPVAETAPPAPVAVAHPAPRPRPDVKHTSRRTPETGGSRETADSATAHAAGEERIYKQIDLPEDVRRDLPKLTIGGASYSGYAASRMVMINGQIFHEGDTLTPGLVLERIKLKSAVLSYKGYRYEVTF